MEFKKRNKSNISGAKVYQYGAILSILAAAGIGGYGVYNAQRTVPVLVAAHKIEPYTFVNGSDFKVANIKASDVFSDTIHGFVPSELNGKMATIGVLPGDQIRMSMLNDNSSLQDMVTSENTTGYVVAGLSYKAGTVDQYVPSGAYVNLSIQGPNNTMNEVNGIKVLQNTGYTPTPTVAQQSSGNNQNAPSPMLILEIPNDKYSSIGASIANGQVQVLMVNQNNVNAGLSSFTTSSASSPNNSSISSGAQKPSSVGFGGTNAQATVAIQPGAGSLGNGTSTSQTATANSTSQKGGVNSAHK